MSKITDLVLTTTLGTEDLAIIRQGTIDKSISLSLGETLSWAKREGYTHLGEHAVGVVFSTTESFTTYQGRTYFVKEGVSLPYTSTVADASLDSNLQLGVSKNLSNSYGPNNKPKVSDIQGMTLVAMVNFDGITAGTPIRSSLNVKRIVDNGVGDYTIEFTNAVSLDKRAIICGQLATPAQNQSTAFGEHVSGSTAPTVISTTEIRLLARRDAHIDIARAYVMVFGELV